MRGPPRFAALASLCLLACSGHYPYAGAHVRLQHPAPGLPAPPPACLVANHVHTIVSDRYSHAPGPDNTAWAYSPAGLRDAIAAFTAEGVDAIVVTDHNAIDAAFDPQVKRAGLTVIGGMEWTTRSGHALLIGFTAAGPADAILPPPWRRRPALVDFRAMVTRTHARGGLVVIAHPRVPFRKWPEDSFGADGVEVWGLDNFLMRNPAARRWWHDRLVLGERLVAVAGTDLHPGARIRRHRYPLNWVSAPRCDGPAIVAAMRAGHVQIVRDRDAPRILLGVEAGGALDFAEAQAGDTVAASDTIDLSLRVLGGAGAQLRVLGRGGVLLTRTIDSADVALRTHIKMQPGDFVRAELHVGRRLVALSNPIYVR